MTQAKYNTAEGYEVKEYEKDMVHVETSRFSVDPTNYEKTIHKTRHILDPQTWASVRGVWQSQGITFERMLHCPAGTPQGFAAPEPITVK